jgi:tRNA pseudouridine38-40 synthase
LTLFSEEAAPPGAAGVIEGPTVRVGMIVAYLGTGFRGFAAQPGQRTIAGALIGALERALRHTVELTCAGRTDAGVHAWGQVVTFNARADADPAWLLRSINRALAPAIVVRHAAVVAPGFDARRSATGRRYRYTVHNRPVADPFVAATSWHVAGPLDLRVMRLACDPLHGEHDFTSFCRRPATPGASLVRRVGAADWATVGDGLVRFEIEASSFCQQMVRSLVGTMVEIGLGKRRAGEMAAILRAGDRAAAGRLAPPQGLCLWEVSYADRASGIGGRMVDHDLQMNDTSTRRDRAPW